MSKNPLLTPWAEASVALHGTPDRAIIEQQLLLSTRVFKYRPTPPYVNRQIIYLHLSGRTSDASVLLKKAFVAYPSYMTRYACSWKLAPSDEARQLWMEAEKLMDGAIDCQTNTSSKLPQN